MNVVLGITGGSGSGKTVLARAIVERRGADQALRLAQDHYYRDLSHLPLAERAATNFDAPEAVDLDLLAEHLRELRVGRAVERPEYDMRTHVRTGRHTRLEPRPLVVAEGTLIAAHAGVLAALDRSVYVDLEDDLRLARRIARDVSERGRTSEEVLRRWRETVLPMHRLHVEPAGTRADLVVRGDGVIAEMVEGVLAIIR